MPGLMPAFAALFVGGLINLVLLASAAEAQTRAHRFEIAAGTMYGFQDPERPVTAGWIVSSCFDLGRQSFVVEGAWHRDAYALEPPWDFDEVFRERLQSRYWMLMGGVRGGKRQGRVAPYYQVLAGGFAARFRRDYEWPASIDTETANAECGGYLDGVPALRSSLRPRERGRSGARRVGVASRSVRLGEPRPDERRLVGPVVVYDDVHVEVGGHAVVDAVEELAELDGPVAAVRLGDDGGGPDVERCKQRRGAVSPIVVRSPFGPAGLHRQQGRGAVEGLNLGLLVDAQHHGMVWRVDVEADDVADFLNQPAGRATA